MDIIGFDAQISAPKNLKRAIRPVAPRPVAPRSVAPKPLAPRPVAPRPVAPTSVAPRSVAPRPVAPRPVAPRPVAPRPVAPRSVAPRPVAPRPVAPRSVAPRKFAPAQVPYKMIAKTKTSFAPTSKKADRAPMAIIKPSGRSIAVLNKIKNPKLVLQANPIERSFMPVDLPYQTTKSFSKNVPIVNTPFAYNVNTDLIEPDVDSGLSNYYGK